MKQQSKLTELAEKNDKFLASYVERPRTEGQEVNGNYNVDSNGHEAAVENQEETLPTNLK